MADAVTEIYFGTYPIVGMWGLLTREAAITEAKEYLRNQIGAAQEALAALERDPEAWRVEGTRGFKRVPLPVAS
jgi:hypothetical protein